MILFGGVLLVAVLNCELAGKQRRLVWPPLRGFNACFMDSLSVFKTDRKEKPQRGSTVVSVETNVGPAVGDADGEWKGRAAVTTNEHVNGRKHGVASHFGLQVDTDGSYARADGHTGGVAERKADGPDEEKAEDEVDDLSDEGEAAVAGIPMEGLLGLENIYRGPRFRDCDLIWAKGVMGDVREAEAILRWSCKQEPRMDGHDCRVAFNTLLELCANAGDFQAAWRIHAEMRMGRFLTVEQETYDKIVKASAKAGFKKQSKFWCSRSQAASSHAPDIVSVILQPAPAAAVPVSNGAATLNVVGKPDKLETSQQTVVAREKGRSVEGKRRVAAKIPVGATVRLSVQGRQAEAGYRWHEDPLAPTSVGTLISVDPDGDPVVRGSNGIEAPYDWKDIEVVDTSAPASGEKETKKKKKKKSDLDESTEAPVKPDYVAGPAQQKKAKKKNQKKSDLDESMEASVEPDFVAGPAQQKEAKTKKSKKSDIRLLYESMVAPAQRKETKKKHKKKSDLDESMEASVEPDFVAGPTQQVLPAAAGKGPRLYVGNIRKNITRQDLVDTFSEFGGVVAKKDKGAAFGFVTMESQEAASAAVEALNGVEAMGLGSVPLGDKIIVEFAKVQHAPAPAAAVPVSNGAATLNIVGKPDKLETSQQTVVAPGRERSVEGKRRVAAKIKVGATVRLSVQGCQAEPGYRWHEDPLAPTSVGTLVSVGPDGDPVVRGSNGQEAPYDWKDIEVVDTPVPAREAKETKKPNNKKKRKNKNSDLEAKAKETADLRSLLMS